MASYIRDGRAPIPAKASTSRLMQANKAKNTKPEMLLRKALWLAGIRGYRLHSSALPGKPDIAFTKLKLAIFINGCFWHRCPKCDLPLPRSNTDFWREKFNANIVRDQKKVRALRKAGWHTITIWECQLLSGMGKAVKQIERAIRKRKRVCLQ